MVRRTRQAGMTIHAAGLEGHEIGADIAFLKYVDLDTKPARNLNRHTVQRPAVAEKQNVGDPAARKRPRQEAGPSIEIATIIDRTRQLPVKLVAAVEIHAVNAIPRSLERFAEQREKRSRQPLEK